MKKILAVFISAIITIGFMPQTSVAQTNQSIVIIDKVLDRNVPGISSLSIHEVCVATDCPQTKEGVGVATPTNLVRSSSSLKDIEHGSQMVLIANKINPSANIIFIRLVDGKNLNNGTAAQNSLVRAFNWIVQNKNVYNIVSVSGSISIASGKNSIFTKNTCPVTHSANKMVVSSVNYLMSVGVASVFSSGNDGAGNGLGKNSKTPGVGFPACIASAITVGSTDSTPRILIESNVSSDSELADMFALGTYSIGGKNVRGTSASAAAVSAYWSKVYRGSFTATYDYLKTNAKPAQNAYVKTSFFVDVLN